MPYVGGLYRSPNAFHLKEKERQRQQWLKKISRSK